MNNPFTPLEQRIENLPNHIRAAVLRDLADLIPPLIQDALRKRADELDQGAKTNKSAG